MNALLQSPMFGREARGQRLGAIRRNVFPLASCPSPGFYAASGQTVMNNVG